MRAKALGVIAGLATMTAVGLAAPASAADQPTTQQLLDQCAQHRTDSCVFHPSGSMVVYTGSRRFVGGATNCTNAPVTRTFKFEHAETTTNSFGVSISAEAPLGKIFTAGVESSYHREWSFTDTRGDEVQATVNPHTAVRAYAAPSKAKVKGTYELHFGSRYYGHYYWYVNGEVDGQTEGQAWETTVDPAQVNCP
ncbi:hypothetical protein [Kutzneria sp. CA-103260]|uniref:hypothetical protein n=1 Tax=Kutzneria sp. CA-103260 TaxID=2802641 RepID=UPI001BA49629|nr:hypothetical protein [Kutzneria sp. CA-103260]QUQ63731.1 hypothetical protein JJ691_14440 [Kutzneria sp. CA-103260]